MVWSTMTYFDPTQTKHEHTHELCNLRITSFNLFLFILRYKLYKYEVGLFYEDHIYKGLWQLHIPMRRYKQKTLKRCHLDFTWSDMTSLYKCEVGMFYYDHLRQVLWQLHKPMRICKQKDVKRMLFERSHSWVLSGLA